MEWISFFDQKPDDGQRCLVCYKPSNIVMLLTYKFYDISWYDDDDYHFCDFTDVDYWCPLPPYKK